MWYEGLTGKVVTPFDPEYKQARQIYNRAINEYPIAIVYCCSKQDISNAVQWAVRNKIGIRIRSGGHNYEGYCIGTEKLVIDTTLMNNVSINTDKDIVEVEAGTRLMKLYSELYKQGYAFPGGTCPAVAISGLVSGGGIGLSSRYLGLTCDSLLEAKMVNAEGRTIVANECCNPDLFWAIRGAGGGNFGVLSSYKFKLTKKVDRITVIQLEWNDNEPARLMFLRRWQKWLEDLDRRISVFAGIYKKGVYFNAFFYGNPIEAMQVLKPILDILGITTKRIQYMNFLAAVQAIGEEYPKSSRLKDTGRFVYQHFSDDVLNNLIKIIDEAPNDYASFIKVYSLGGAVRDTPQCDTAFFYRNADYILAISSNWDKQSDGQVNKAWVADGFDYIKSITNGSYVNFPYNELKNYEKAYYGQFVNSLERVKKMYDPCDIFNYPQSINI